MKKNKKKIREILRAYFKEIHEIYVARDFREESFYPSFKKLIEECSQFFQVPAGAKVLVLPKRTKVGIPDFRIEKNNEIIGYVEAKDPDANLDEIEDSEQLKRYRGSLPNLILTNLLELRLYRNGNLIDKVEVGRQFTLKNLKLPPVPEKLNEFLDLLQKFFSFSTPKIHKSAELSIELANRTRFLKYILNEELQRENDEVTRFYNAFKEELIDTLTKERFADLYSQTVTYGLFAARMKAQSGSIFRKETAWQFIPESLPLLKEIFYAMMGPHFPESLSWVVDEIIQVLTNADIYSILKEFKNTRWDEDPVIYFYETFLATYNPQERERLGVYYTPLPVVSFIVRSIHNLLKEKFGKSEGLATNDVTLLDPAAGTLTFIVQAIKQVQRELEERKKAGLITTYIGEHVLPHFHAFEILMAPYTVGHFKVSLVLEEMGYQLKKGERFQFYLTNTLEIKTPKQISFLIDLAKEGQGAKKIKEEVPILVVLGNPPYSFKSIKSKFIDELIKSYKEEVRAEKKYGVLEDDYIKFIRFAHWKIEQAGKGIIGFITNNSYLSGVIHRGMRKKLLNTFDEIYILNLHGSSRIGEKTPKGGKDENVFDIQQGVAIALYLKFDKPKKDKKVYYADLWGLRGEKYEYLFKNDVKTTAWTELKPFAPYYFFIPKSFVSHKIYEKFWKLTDIFNIWGSGIITRRDTLAVAYQQLELRQKMLMFSNPNLPDSLIMETYKGVGDTAEWKLSRAREKVRNEQIDNLIRIYHYRPWDFRYIYYSDSMVSRTCKRWMKLLLKKNLALISTRVITDIEEKGAFVSNKIGDIHLISGQSYFFPLYFYDEQLFGDAAMMKDPTPNFNPKFLQIIKESLGIEPTPEEIFYYIYAVLYSPAYRKRFEEFLKIDFPRIPVPFSFKVFKELSNHGKELVDIHLLNHPALSETGISFPKAGSNIVEKVFYDKESQKVFINKEQCFDGISNEVWEYQIGAYQVMEKYLKERKGRRLSLDEINHFMKVAKAILLTIKLQEIIDKIYEDYNF